MSPSVLVSRYFDFFSEPLFTSHADGRERFYPFGIYGRGRIVPDAARGLELRSQVKWAYAGMFLGIGLLSAPLGIWLGLGLATVVEIMILLPLLFWRLHTVASDLEGTGERLTLAAAQHNQGQKFSRSALLTLGALGIVGSALMAWLAYGSGQAQLTEPVMRVLLTGTALLLGVSGLSGIALAIRKR